MRLRTILGTLRSSVNAALRNYADFGYSNGFIANQILGLLGIPDATGYDYSDNDIPSSSGALGD